MAALVGNIPVDQLVEALLGPALWRRINLAGEDRHRNRDLADLDGIGRAAAALRRISRGTRGRGSRVGQPVQADRVQNLVAAEDRFGITLAVAPFGELLVIERRHGGRGIREPVPEEQLGTVIRPFVRLGSGPNAVEGLGVGLATASNLAHTLSGSLSLSNRAGGGLKARIRLPGYQNACP